MPELKMPKRLALWSVVMVMLAAFMTTLSYGDALAAQSNLDRLAVENPQGLEGPAKIGQNLVAASGAVDIVIQLKGQPIALGGKGADIAAAQASLMSKLAKYGVKEIARLNTALNAVILQADASQITQIAKEYDIKTINKVGTYDLLLDSTVPYIGATEAQNLGYKGTGKKVAVLDSGVDYTHAALGGPGTLAAYEAAYGTSPADPRNTRRDGLFPTAKVYEGYDFVGEAWPNGPLKEDDDPIDYEGHGTHVADIIAGKKGVAPDAKILAVKVCSAVATSCSGVALLKGVDYALDPNRDQNISDKVDVMNLSLGQSYGQIEDDLTYALENAVKAGVVVVASAGNSADKPYIAGSPSTGAGVISVAQTQVPGAISYPLVINSPADIAGVYPNTATVDWAPITTGFTGDVVFIGRACPGDTLLANPAGKVALIDRGACAVSLKVDVAAKAGATGVLIGLVAPGDAVSFSFGGGDKFVQTLVIIQSYASRIKSKLSAGTSVNVSVSPAVSTPLKGSVVGSSSRGPSISTNAIKPDIAAPGASVSAEVGTGTGTTAFGGTSGAAPMVSGSALLVRQKYPNYTPYQVKALLMNTAETNILTNPTTLPGELAPITRIGAGEVRVNRAIKSGLLAIEPNDMTGSLSYGFVAVNNNTIILKKKVKLTNLTNEGRLYKITPTFRYANDQSNGAVQILGPSQTWLSPNQTIEFELQLMISGPRLRDWNLNAGTGGGSGSTINELEYDGYIVIDGGGDTNKVTLPWHVFPRKASDVRVRGTFQTWNNGPVKALQLSNDLGLIPDTVEVFNLLATNGRQPASALPKPGDNFALVDLKEFGVRDAGGVIQFAVTTYGERATPTFPAEFDIYVNTNSTPEPEYVIYNIEQGTFTGSFAGDGRTLVAVQKLKPDGTNDGGARAFYYADANYNSANLILTVPASALGLTAGQKFGVYVSACDNYFTGVCTDKLPGAGITDPTTYATYTLGQARFSISNLPWTNPKISDPLTFTVTNNGLQVQLNDTGNAAASDSKGLLLLYRNGSSGRESEAVRLP